MFWFRFWFRFRFMINNVDLELIGVGYYDLIYMNVGVFFVLFYLIMIMI